MAYNMYLTTSRKGDRMDKLTRLSNKAYKGQGIMESACSELLQMILKKINIDDDHMIHVFIQDGDGLVLAWEGRRGSMNTPVDSIFWLFNKEKRILNEEDLLSISI